MDLNPQTPEWYLEEGPYELADYCVSENVNTVVLCNAWLDSRKGEEEDGGTDLQTVGHWAARLRPLWTGDDRGRSKLSKQGARSDTIVIACNRTGVEKGK
jgi:protein N-terminal amidase